MKAIMILPLLVLCCCSRQNAPAQNQEPVAELKTYKVPNGMGEQIVEALNMNLSAIAKTAAPGRAEVLPNGNVLLLAPPQIQAGMKELIANLEASQNPEVNTQMELWVLLVHKSKGEELPPDLSKALASVESPGERNYRIVEKFTLQGATGEKLHVNGRLLYLDAILTKRGHQKRADIRVGLGMVLRLLDSRIYLEQDRYLMLGQASFDLDSDSAKAIGVEPGVYALRYVFKASEPQSQN